MYGEEIPFSTSVKYLGITLDQRLKWRMHIENNIKSAKRHLMLVQNTIGKMWGPSPRLTRWLYTSVVRPAISYGSVVWSRACNAKWATVKMTRLHRMIAMAMAPMRKSTPTAGLEVLLGLMPLDIFLQGEGIRAFYRVSVVNETN